MVDNRAADMLIFTVGVLVGMIIGIVIMGVGYSCR